MSVGTTLGAMVLAQQNPGTSNNNGGGGWDLNEFFTNGQNYAERAGGSLLALAGTVLLIWGGVSGVKKFMSERDQTSWVKIGGMVFVGGLLIFGGIAWLMNVSSGAKDTVDNFGDTGALAPPAATAPAVPGSA